MDTMDEEIHGHFTQLVKVSGQLGVGTSCLSNIPLAALLNMLWTYVLRLFLHQISSISTNFIAQILDLGID